MLLIVRPEFSALPIVSMPGALSPNVHSGFSTLTRLQSHGGLDPGSQKLKRWLRPRATSFSPCDLKRNMPGAMVSSLSVKHPNVARHGEHCKVQVNDSPSAALDDWQQGQSHFPSRFSVHPNRSAVREFYFRLSRGRPGLNSRPRSFLAKSA